jgi:hypothetical protein
MLEALELLTNVMNYNTGAHTNRSCSIVVLVFLKKEVFVFLVTLLIIANFQSCKNNFFLVQS